MIKAVIWDIGGVLLEDPKINSFWKNTDSKTLRHKFGCGEISINEFIKQGAKFLNINESDFLKKYKISYFSINIIKDGYNIFKKMKTNKYILSDTNPLHSKYIKENYPELFDLSKKVYLSNEIGFRKNSIEVFEYVIKDLGLNSNEVLFIDNKKEIVHLAKSIGINGIVYTNKNNLIYNLKKYDFMINSHKEHVKKNK